ncbi:MAG: AAA family ATPase [Synergistaceae bacterium]|nr:AAA family ATPase [Synergistaceae bacterium]MBR1601844.1 AAA family ATPase [Synergistaceae bacterium]MBR1601852.1 AAA family ATPase [Synergistaceae bacterium]
MTKFEYVPERDIREQVERFIYDTLNVKGEVDLKLDGQTHRVAIDGDKGSETSGEYRFYTDGCPAGYVRDYRNNEFRTWKFDFKALKDSQPQIYQQSQTREFKAHAAAIQQERSKNEAKEKAARTIELETEFNAAKTATDEHAYLQRKKVKNDGTLKVNQAGELLIGLYDADGKFKTYQRILSDGNKKLAYGGDKTGAFHIIGGHELTSGDKIILAEGYATAASIYKNIGDMARVVMAVDCHNLLPVAQAIKSKFRPKCLLIAADDDSRKHKDGTNPGLEAAIKCVKSGAADGYELPPFGSFDEDDDTDFNDFAILHEDEIADVFSKALEKYTPRPWIIPANELMDNFQPTEWLIDDWIPEQSQILLFGASGAGKSFITLDMAASIACSNISEWHGLTIEHGGVLYLNGEGYNGLTKRLKGWAQVRDVSRDNINLYISQQPKLITGSEVTDWIINEIKAQNIQDLKLIIVDTLSRHFGGDENNASDATNFLNQLSAIQREFNCSVLITHHTGVSNEAQGRGRGSSAFKGAVDMELQIKSDGSGEDFYVTLSQTKNKDDEIKEALTFKRLSVPLDGVFNKRGKQIFTAVLERMDAPTVKSASAQLKITATIKRALETYAEAADTAGTFTEGGEKFYGVRYEEWRNALYKRSSSDKESSKRGEFSRTRKALIDNLGILNTEDGGGNEKGDIYRPAAGFKEYIAAVGLTSKMEQVRLTSKGEII